MCRHAVSEHHVAREELHGDPHRLLRHGPRQRVGRPLVSGVLSIFSIAANWGTGPELMEEKGFLTTHFPVWYLVCALCVANLKSVSK